MAGALSLGTLVALGAAVVLTACSGNAGSPPAGSPSTGRPAASSGEAGVVAGCPSPAPHRVSPASVLVPGPSNGLPRSRVAGDRLVIAAVVLDAQCHAAAGASVHVWHTDASGRYGPSGGGTDEIECCYYQGTVITDRGGGFRLETVRPGRYDQQNAPPAHIHLEIHHSSGDLMAELVFADDSTRPAPSRHDGTIPVTLRKVHDADGNEWNGAVVVLLRP